MRPFRLLPLGAFALNASALLALGGCVSFGPKPPKDLLTLHATTSIAPGTTRTTTDARAIAVNIPNVQPSLATQRVMVQDGPNKVAYVKDVAWAAAPALLFRNLLAETIEAKTDRVVADTRATGLAPDTRLSGQIVEFGLDGPGQAAVVTFDAVVSRSGSETVRTQRFTARVPVTAETGPAVGVAVDAAANQVAAAVAGWIG